MEKVVLKNGLCLELYPMPNTHSITVALYVRAGSKFESERENGITHFLEHLHFRHLGDLSQRELYYRMESIGSTLRAATGRDYLRFSMKILPKYLPDCLEIFKRVITADNWTQSDLELESAVVSNQIAEHYYTNGTLLRSLVYKGDPLEYEIMGTAENVQSFMPEQIIAYKRKIFNSRNMILCIAGNIDNDGTDTVKRAFEPLSLNRGERLEKIGVPKGFFKRKPNIAFDYADWEMLEVHMAFDVPPGVSAKDLNLLNCIVGEGVGSRLQCVLREELGYTSDIGSYIELYEECASFHIEYTVGKKHFVNSLSALVNVLNRAKKDIGENDLRVSLPFYSENLDFLLDDTEEMSKQIGFYGFILGKSIELGKQYDIDSLCVELRELAKKIFVTKNICLAVTGDCRSFTKKAVSGVLESINQ